MRAKLIFNLPEDNYDFKHATKGADYIAALEDIANKFRGQLKYNSALTKDEQSGFEKAVDLFYEMLNEYDIKLFQD